MTHSPTDLSDEVFGTLRDELAQMLDCPPSHIDLSARLTELPGIDSMKIVQAVAKCEKRWQIVLDQDELVEVRSGADLADLIVHTLNTDSDSA